MVLAQRLYQEGHISYMRTDSTNLSGEAVEACRGYIEDQFGAPYLPEEALSYSSKEGAQEAHEAIRPSDVNVGPGDIAGLEPDQERLYSMIWRQFVACQMPPARYLSTSIVVNVDEFELRTRGRILVFDGYTKVQPPTGKGDRNAALPDVQVGEELSVRALDPVQHFTKPPPRYSEASLVRELEKCGIGRPSTYASIISSIQDRGYARVEGRRFYAEKIGEIVTERLVENFEELMDFGFTAELEESLDEVALGKKQWKDVLGKFYSGFKKQVEAAGSEMGGMRANLPTDTDHSLPEMRTPNADPNGFHGSLPGLLGLRPTAQGALQVDDQSCSRGRGRQRRCRRPRRGRGPVAAQPETLWSLQDHHVELPRRRRSQVACLREQPGLRRIRSGRGPVSHQGIRWPRAPVRQVRRGNAAEVGALWQIFRVH